jgi:ketosteroid isomerase-like protein
VALALLLRTDSGSTWAALAARREERDTAQAVSQENVETLQRARAAWNADNLDAALAELDPEVEWHPAIERALERKGTTYRGHDGVRKAWDEYRGEAWGGLTSQIQEIRDLGESVLLLGHLDVTGRTTGIDFNEQLGQLVTFRGGRIVRSHDFLSHAEALEAAGLSEYAGRRDRLLGLPGGGGPEGSLKARAFGRVAAEDE